MPNANLEPALPHSISHLRDGHVVQLYNGDEFLIDTLSRFIGGALGEGQAAVLVVTRPHRAELERRLAIRGLDITKMALQGRYVALDVAETLPRFMVNGTVDTTKFQDVVDGVLMQVRATIGKEARIAIFGELVALLWAEGKTEDAVKIEQLWNELAKKHSFSLLCAYPILGFNMHEHIEPFLKMCGQHSDVLPTESHLSLTSDEERLRDIARLQQRTQVLERELALRQSETRFRLLVEAAQDYAIFMLDPEGRISSWNPGAERLKGYKTEEILGRHFSCFYPEEDLAYGKPQWELVIASKEGRFEDEGWRLRKDGSRFWANVIITAMRDEAGTLIGYAKVTRDFTERMRAQMALQDEVEERRQAERKLFESEKSLRQLSLHLLRTQDEERRRIGRDLHDSLGQYLAVLKMKLASLAPDLGEAEAHLIEDVAECIRLTDESIKEMRTVSYLLYPPMLEEMGLKSAIPWYLDGFSARSEIKTTFEVDAKFDRLPRDSELALFRVLQESLTNVHRHSGSATAHVCLFISEGRGVLEIQDRGKGIDARQMEQFGEDWMGALGVGVRGMNERMRQLGGTLQLVQNQVGTTVRAAVPLSESLDLSK